MNSERPITVLLGALGGQGGGVLADWLTVAAERAGYPAQSTSTPGVAQRTGATTYYFELFPDKNPPAKPIFSLFPSAGDVDLMAALEPTEAGRAVEKGHVTRRTTVITAAERMYSTAEKVAAGDGTIDVGPVLEAVKIASKATVALNMKDLSDGVAQRANAILLGAIAESGVLPISVDDFRGAIEDKGVAVTSNVTGFETGREAFRKGGSGMPQTPGKEFKTAPAGFEEAIATYPEALRPIVEHGIARLVDYQNAAYARRYLDRLSEFRDLDTSNDKRLVEAVAKSLASWMSYEDVIRVAQLKTRPDRFDKIREELSIQDGAPLRITDFFKPGREESLGVLPKWLNSLVPTPGKKNAGQGMRLKWRTTSAWGYAGLKLLASLKAIRPKGEQFAEEQAKIEVWLDAVRAAAPVDVDLATATAKLAIWSRGYGDIRRTGQERLAKLLANYDQRLATDRNELSAEVDQQLILAHANPELEGAMH